MCTVGWGGARSLIHLVVHRASRAGRHDAALGYSASQCGRGRFGAQPAEPSREHRHDAAILSTSWV
eukprot:4837463-Prymnesium_polylepis.1